MIQFRALCAHLRLKRKISARSQQRLIAAWKIWYKFIKSEYVLKGIILPKVKKLSPRPLNLEAIHLFINIKCENWIEYRNKALWIFLYTTGLRISEALMCDCDILNQE